MRITPTEPEGLLILEPKVFKDERGFFIETYHRERYETNGISCPFVQDNLSYSIKGTLRGLHYQYPHGQAKLVQVLKGEVFDVAVDIRLGSPTFGQWKGVLLSAENHLQFFIPEGFAHGFCVTSDDAIFTYKCSNAYNPKTEGGVVWNDSEIAINWPVESPLLSDKDSGFKPLRDVPDMRLPKYQNNASSE